MLDFGMCYNSVIVLHVLEKEFPRRRRISSCSIRSSFRCAAESSVWSDDGGDGGIAEEADLAFSASSVAIISSTTSVGASA